MALFSSSLRISLLLSLGLVLLVRAEVVISPTSSGNVPADCGIITAACTSAAPCGPGVPPTNSVFEINLTEPCVIRVLEGNWTVPVMVNSGYDVTVQGSAPQLTSNLNLTVTISTTMSHATIVGMNMVSSNLTLIADSIFVDSSNFDMNGPMSSFLDFSGPITLIRGTNIDRRGLGGTLLRIAGQIVIEQCIIKVPGMYFTDSSVSSAAIRGSTILARKLFSTVSMSFIAESSHFHGFETFIVNEDTSGSHYPPLHLELYDVVVNGTSAANPTLMFEGNLMTSFNLTASSLQHVRVSGSLRISESLTIHNSSLNDAELLFQVGLLTTQAAISENRFVWSNPSTFPLHLSVLPPSQFGVVHIRDNTFQYTGSLLPANGSAFIGGLNISADSNLEVESMFIQGRVRWMGNLTVHSHINGSKWIHEPLSYLQGIREIANTAPTLWVLDSIILNVVFTSEHPIIYSVTDAPLGIRPEYSVLSPTVGNVPLMGLRWSDPHYVPKNGDRWPIFIDYGSGAEIPSHSAFPDEFNFTISFIDECDLIPACALVFEIGQVRCPTTCHPQHSISPCIELDTCLCQDGWYGVSCDQDQPPSPPSTTPNDSPSGTSPSTVPGCPGDSPGPGFTCINGQWVSSTPVEEPVFEIPPNSGPIVIEGDLNVTQTIVFNGLGSEVVVNGCVIIEGEVVVELTESELEELLGGGKTKVLISSISDGACTNATDLSQVEIITKSPKECSKVSGQNTGTRQSLSVLFNVDASGCKKKSNLVAIVVPSVIGAVIILGVIGALIWWKIRHDMMHKP